MWYNNNQILFDFVLIFISWATGFMCCMACNNLYKKDSDNNDE